MPDTLFAFLLYNTPCHLSRFCYTLIIQEIYFSVWSEIIMNSKEIIEEYNSAVVSSYGRLDLALESGYFPIYRNFTYGTRIR